MNPPLRFASSLRGLALAVLLVAPLAAAQPAPKKDTSVRDAVALFKANNSAAAVAAIQAKVRPGPGAAHADLQVARRLAAVSAVLRSGGEHARAREATTLALARLAQPEGKMSARDAAAALTLAGGLHEQNGDTASAKLAYQRAAALDPTQKQAADRLALIVEREKRAAAKPAANLVLQQRTAAAAPKK
jgi:tetratricopeptide (TPR) repeat protein